MNAPDRPTKPAEYVLGGRAVVGEVVYIRCRAARPTYTGAEFVDLGDRSIAVEPSQVLTRKELVAAIKRSET